MRDVSGATAYGEVATEKQSVLYCKYCLASENASFTVSCLPVYLIMESRHRGATGEKKRSEEAMCKKKKKLRNTGIQYI